jgi:hypothetical protein
LIGDDCRGDMDEGVKDRAVFWQSERGKLLDVADNRLRDIASGEERLVEERDGQRFHITAHACHERQPPPQQLLGQFFANIAFVTEQLANQVFGQLRYQSGVADITFGQLEGHDLALLVEHQMQLPSRPGEFHP